MPWHVLNHIAPGRQRTAQRIVSDFNEANTDTLELFAPTFVNAVQRDGKIIYKDEPLTFHYVFVNGSEDSVKKLCAQKNGFSFVIDRAGNHPRHALVSDDRISSLKIAALAYSNKLPFCPVDELDLHEGDWIEIAEGPFAGLQGTYLPRPRSNKGDIYVAVAGGLGTVVYGVKASSVKILEFSAHTRRIYDRLDNFEKTINNTLSLLRKIQTSHNNQAATNRPRHNETADHSNEIKNGPNANINDDNRLAALERHEPFAVNLNSKDNQKERDSNINEASRLAALDGHEPFAVNLNSNEIEKKQDSNINDENRLTTLDGHETFAANLTPDDAKKLNRQLNELRSHIRALEHVRGLSPRLSLRLQSLLSTATQFDNSQKFI